MFKANNTMLTSITAADDQVPGHEPIAKCATIPQVAIKKVQN